jgi:molybdopterin molybdotransferase
MSAHPEPSDLVPLDRYRRDALARIGPLEPIELGLLEAHGCVLAEDVTAPADVPPFRNSAMDGYAVRSDDVSKDAALRITGEVAAGHEHQAELAPGEAVRIMTGAPMPAGADTVVPVELTAEDDHQVRFTATVPAGANVRPAGESVRAGEQVLAAGRRLDAADMGILAAVGRSNALVRPRPRVVVIATGDELVEAGGALGPGQIADSNSYMLTAMARESGATAYRHHLVRDDRRALEDAFEDALVQGDLLVTSGGVSVGRYDLVREVLASFGDVRSVKVAMQPGMPQAFGFIGEVPCFGLPGNPVSAFVSFEIFVRPALRRMQGRTDLNRPRVTAVADEPINSPKQKVSFPRVTLTREPDGWHARLTGSQSSGVLRSLVQADGLGEVPLGRTRIAAGERLVVHLLLDGTR